MFYFDSQVGVCRVIVYLTFYIKESVKGGSKMTDRQANVKLRSYQTSDCMDINLYKNHHLILVTKR